MNSPVNPHIEIFRKAFPITYGIFVTENAVTYRHQTYRIEETVQQAKDLILKHHLSLDVTYNKFLHTITVNVIGELDRLDNAWGAIIEKLGKLQDQL